MTLCKIILISVTLFMFFGNAVPVKYPLSYFVSNTICKHFVDQYRAAEDKVNGTTDLTIICSGKSIKNLVLPVVPETSQKIIENNVFDPSEKLYVLITGMYDSPTKGHSKKMIEALEATTGPHNYIVLDHTKISLKSYLDLFRTVYLSRQMGDLLGELLVELYSKGVTNPSKIHIISMSLGAQIAGRVGKMFFNKTGKKISKITALDPAGHCFDYTENHLSKNDAEYVEAIHTQVTILGSVKNVGHITYLPNGGGPYQPGCPTVSFCSHWRACDFYIEKLWNKTEPFYARKCGSWFSFLLGSCNNNDITIMTNDDTSKTGYYFFKTRSSKPFSMGIYGALSSGPNNLVDFIG